MALIAIVMAANRKSCYIWYVVMTGALVAWQVSVPHPQPFLEQGFRLYLSNLPSRQVSSPCNKSIGFPVCSPGSKVNSIQKPPPTCLPPNLLYLHCSSSHSMATLFFDLFKSKAWLLFSLSHVALNLAEYVIGLTFKINPASSLLIPFNVVTFSKPSFRIWIWKDNG